MPERPVNPYKSPSAASDQQRGLRQAPPKPDFFWPIVLNAVMLIAMLATQAVFKRWLDTLEAELPFLTTVALGPVFPSILAGSLLATLALRRLLIKERFRNTWVVILVVVLGVAAGFCIVAFSLPFMVGIDQLT